VGIEGASQRFVAEYNSLRDWNKLRGFFLFGRRITFALSFLLAFLLVTIVSLLSRHIGSNLSNAFFVAALLLPVLALFETTEAYLRALKRVIQAQAPQEILRPLLIGLGILLFSAMIDRSPSAGESISFNLGATSITFILAILFLRRAIPKPVLVAKPTFESKAWFSVGLTFVAADGFYLLLSQADIIMLGIFLGAKTAGIYSVASRLATLISFSHRAAHTIGAPLISELHTTNQRRELKRVLRLSVLGITSLALPTLVILLIAGKWILGLFGPEFSEGYISLIILSAGQILIAMVGLVGTLMFVTGHHARAARIVGINAALNILLNAVLIPMFGMLGAAVASLITTICSNSLMLVFTIRNLGLNPSLIGPRLISKLGTITNTRDLS
jgi:O-antigen/teichoic acid export membrane protein